LPAVGCRPDILALGRFRRDRRNGQGRWQQNNVCRRYIISSVKEFLAKRTIGGVVLGRSRALSVRQAGLDPACRRRSLRRCPSGNSRCGVRREMDMCLGNEVLDGEGGNGEDKCDPRPKGGVFAESSPSQCLRAPAQLPLANSGLSLHNPTHVIPACHLALQPGSLTKVRRLNDALMRAAR
jgi:hypothetical protein